MASIDAQQLYIGNKPLTVGKMKISSADCDTKKWKDVNTFSCTATIENTEKNDINLGILFGDWHLMSRYRFYPRRMKKALKKLAKGDYKRKTRLMNKLTSC
jgi:hypothetical protein